MHRIKVAVVAALVLLAGFGVAGAETPIEEVSLARPNDLVAWVEWARARTPDLQVHLLGHSEGALFAKAAALRIEVASVISLVGAGRSIGVVLREQTEGRRPGEIGVEFEQILSSLESGEEVGEVSPLHEALVPVIADWLDTVSGSAAAASLSAP